MADTQLNIWQILWDSGFVVKFVLISLLACSAVSWMVIFQKFKELKDADKANKEFLTIFQTHSSLSELFLVSQNFKHSNLGLIFRKGYDELNKLNEKLGDKKLLADYLREQKFVPLERSLKQGIAQSQEKFDYRLSTLATIGSVSPFVGLFGTVWGIIDAFAGLSRGGGSIEAVAPGIAEALVATAVGLAAAIPAVWFFNRFNNQLNRMNVQMESFGQDFLNVIERSILSFR
jgi:biopolymer transport protein TolQ